MGVTTPRPDFRILPRINDHNEFFWTSGADGRLRFQRCGACGYWIHPSGPVCPVCHSRDLAPEAVAGEAVLHTYTVNHQAWLPGFEPPYVVAIVELPEQEGLRLTTNLVNCALEDVRIGMPVRVVFEQWEDVWLPLFEPA
ncbi:MAG TPA: Zn-ribbon domain-containing OB-fold protein [Acidimicrobiales bacterium]